MVESSSADIAITPDGKSVYVTNDGVNLVSVINTTLNSEETSIAVGMSPRGIAITPLPLPPPSPPSPPLPPGMPTDLSGKQIKGADSVLEKEYVNILNWKPNVEANDVTGYFVSRDGIRIATLSASTFQYIDHNRKKGEITQYAVTSFSSDNRESLPITVIIH